VGAALGVRVTGIGERRDDAARSDRLTLASFLCSRVESDHSLGSDGEQMICAALLYTLGFGKHGLFQ